MPELPEVETVRRTLSTLVLHKIITDCIVPYEKIIRNVSYPIFRSALIHERIEEVRRVGKYLILILSSKSLIIHLRMEGKFFIRKPTAEISKHEHVIFQFDDGTELRYHDTRKFGEFHLINTTDFSQIIQSPPIHKLGREPFLWVGKEDEFYQIIRNRKTSIKAILLNQQVIAGLGNIYVDEVCFLSSIHPSTPCYKLSQEDATIIIKNACLVLNKAIELGGTTIRSYTNMDGVHGRFQNELLVHGRENELCHKCHNIIYKTKVAGRGTYYCSACQKDFND